MKYKTYKELIDAFASGELDKEKYVLVMDNDCCSLSYIGGDWDEDDPRWDEELFEGNGYCDMVYVCNAAGIPTEYC